MRLFFWSAAIHRRFSAAFLGQSKSGDESPQSKRRRGAARIVALCAAIAVQTACLRTATAEEDPYPPVKIVLHPAPEPRPALKYRLLPDILDRKPGNAAVVYGKVKAEQPGFFGNAEVWEKINMKWIVAPLAELRKEVGKQFAPDTVFYYLDRAARCQYCDWQLPIGEPGQDMWSILLPEIQEMRAFGRLLAVQARVQIAHGKYDEAVGTLQTGYAMSRHVGEAPFIVGSLVAIACSSMMSDQVREFIQQPDSPNLYWGLTNLPRPLVDMRPAFDVEMQALYFSFPELRDLEHKDYPPQQWQQLMEKTVDRLYGLYQYEGGPREWRSRDLFRLAILGLTLRNYPDAKRFLIARGHSAAEVEVMPVPKAVLLYTMSLYDERRDDMFKWFNLPYPEFRAHYQRAEKRLMEVSRQRREIIPLAAILLPALGSANAARARHERDFAVLRVFEALRLYGAAHNRLPDELSDITEVPVPADPVTGSPFVYRRSGDNARLEAPPPAGEWPGRFGTWRYDIQFVPKGK